MGVLGNLPDQGAAIRSRHPVFGFDFFLGIKLCLETRIGLRRLITHRIFSLTALLIKALRVHALPLLSGDHCLQMCHSFSRFSSFLYRFSISIHRLHKTARETAPRPLDPDS